MRSMGREDSDQIWRMPRLILAGRTWHLDLEFAYIVRRYGW